LIGVVLFFNGGGEFMTFYIKEWPNKNAILMTHDGVVIGTFRNADEARRVWQDWCNRQRNQEQFSLVG